MTTGGPRPSVTSVLLVAGFLLLGGCRIADRGLPDTSSPNGPTSSADSGSSTDGEASVPVTTDDPGAVKPSVGHRGTVIESSVSVPDGTQRTFRLYLPSTLGTDEVPLLVALHGGIGWGAQFAATSGFDRLAEEHGFIVVYPDGTPLGSSNSRVWNGGNCCGTAQQDRRDVDDVGFIATLIESLATDHPIDPNRVFATGHSNGAIMSYRLACELAGTIAAVGFQAGSLEVDECVPASPVSVFHIHGTSDTSIPIDGGLGQGIAKTEFRSPRDSIATFAALNGCGAPVETVDRVNPDLTHRTWASCRDGTVVEMVEVRGAGHPWMGQADTEIQRALFGESYADYDASAAIWDFLARHPRR